MHAETATDKDRMRLTERETETQREADPQFRDRRAGRQTGKHSRVKDEQKRELVG